MWFFWNLLIMRITELQYSKRRAGSEVIVRFDDNSAIALDAEVAVRFHLARGMELSEEQVDEVRQANHVLLARRKLIQYLALRKKSTADSRLYLKKRGFPEEASENAIAYATDNGYINDSDFAESLARTRIKAGTKGPRAVKNELIARGIDREEARRAVEFMAEPETQLETARKVAARKYPHLKDSDDPVKAAQKLSQHLARRGFDPHICDIVTREYFGDPTIF